MPFLSHHFPHYFLLLLPLTPAALTPPAAMKKYLPRDQSITAEWLAFPHQTECLQHQSRCHPPHKPFLLHTVLGGKENLHANKPHQFINQNEFVH